MPLSRPVLYDMSRLFQQFGVMLDTMKPDHPMFRVQVSDYSRERMHLLLVTHHVATKGVGERKNEFLAEWQPTLHTLLYLTARSLVTDNYHKICLGIVPCTNQHPYMVPYLYYHDTMIPLPLSKRVLHQPEPC